MAKQVYANEDIIVEDTQSICAEIMAEAAIISASLKYERTLVCSGGTYDTYSYTGGETHINRHMPGSLVHSVLRTAERRINDRLGLNAIGNPAR